MKLITCIACQFGNCERCSGTYKPPHVDMGGEMCICRHDGKQQKHPSIAAMEALIREAEGPPMQFSATCIVCRKIKRAPDLFTLAYRMAFHMDRRHRGWTDTHASVGAGDAAEEGSS